ncbi:MAG: hypothetical protein UT02_C0048G0013 [Parcubacteria group bacterium GW2011_GWC2_38_7]|nr:MAG: hypothetical protein UT02_C0048G0013 [Parcubacteria group bacterium GW2011_GWC2_38_7]
MTLPLLSQVDMILVPPRKIRQCASEVFVTNGAEAEGLGLSSVDHFFRECFFGIELYPTQGSRIVVSRLLKTASDDEVKNFLMEQAGAPVALTTLDELRFVLAQQPATQRGPLIRGSEDRNRFFIRDYYGSIRVVSVHSNGRRGAWSVEAHELGKQRHNSFDMVFSLAESRNTCE